VEIVRDANGGVEMALQGRSTSRGSVVLSRLLMLAALPLLWLILSSTTAHADEAPQSARGTDPHSPTHPSAIRTVDRTGQGVAAAVAAVTRTTTSTPQQQPPVTKTLAPDPAPTREAATLVPVVDTGTDEIASPVATPQGDAREPARPHERTTPRPTSDSASSEKRGIVTEAPRSPGGARAPEDVVADVDRKVNDALESQSATLAAKATPALDLTDQAVDRLLAFTATAITQCEQQISRLLAIAGEAALAPVSDLPPVRPGLDTVGADLLSRVVGAPAWSALLQRGQGRGTTSQPSQVLAGGSLAAGHELVSRAGDASIGATSQPPGSADPADRRTPSPSPSSAAALAAVSGSAQYAEGQQPCRVSEAWSLRAMYRASSGPGTARLPLSLAHAPGCTPD
jgi:hypothetical protein